jgi:hypothetical protein
MLKPQDVRAEVNLLAGGSRSVIVRLTPYAGQIVPAGTRCDPIARQYRRRIWDQVYGDVLVAVQQLGGEALALAKSDAAY